MITALIIAGLFYFGGALFTGKFLKNKLKIWKALLVTFMCLILWAWFLHFSYEGNVPDAALSQVGFGCAMLFFGLRSKMFLAKKQEKKAHNNATGKSKKST